MSVPLMWTLIAWGIITAILLLLLMYRSLISMKEDDQLFLDPLESKMQAEQNEIQVKIGRIRPYAMGLSYVSGGLLLLSGGLWLYEALARF